MLRNKYNNNISAINALNINTLKGEKNNKLRILHKKPFKNFAAIASISFLLFSYSTNCNALTLNNETSDNKTYMIALNDKQDNVIKTPTAEETRNGNFLSYNGAPVLEDDNYIYYLDKAQDDDGNPAALYRMQKDGSNPEQISHSVICNNLSIDGKYMYFFANIPMASGLICKNLDTLEETPVDIHKSITVSEDGTHTYVKTYNEAGGVDSLIEKDGWIYYVVKNSHRSDYSLHKIKTDGTENTPLKDRVDKFTVTSDRIFYASGNKLNSVDLNGNDDKTVLTDKVYDYYILGDSIYYRTLTYFMQGRNKSSAHAIKKANLDGSNAINVFYSQESDYTLNNVAIYGDWLYFATTRIPMDFTPAELSGSSYSVNAEYGFYRIKSNSENLTDIKKAELISSDSIVNYMFINNQLWYKGNNNAMCKLDLRP